MFPLLLRTCLTRSFLAISFDLTPLWKTHSQKLKIDPFISKWAKMATSSLQEKNLYNGRKLNHSFLLLTRLCVTGFCGFQKILLKKFLLQSAISFTWSLYVWTTTKLKRYILHLTHYNTPLTNKHDRIKCRTTQFLKKLNPRCLIQQIFVVYVKA